jgi:hypothetical protein
MRHILRVVPRVLAPILLATSACELVLGDLPTPRDPDGDAGPDASTSSGAGGSSSSSGTGACCDCDSDEHDAQGTCGGDDCDDHDPDAHPGATAFHAEPNTVVGYDWDCNGMAERDPALEKAVDCAAIGLPCAAGTGFLAKVPPPCGGMGDWGTCKQSGISCVKDIVEAGKAMTCR